MPYMTRLLPDLKKYFPRVDTVPGWETRGSSSFAPAGVVCHWTAGPRGTTKRASLAVVTNGRPGLSGPLCNVYLDREGIPVIVAAGRANHAGPGTWKGLVGNSAVYGIEAESAGDDDWTDAQKIAYPRLVRAMLDGLGRSADYACGHNEWAPTRKIDIRDWPMSYMRSQITNITPEDDMPLTPTDLAKVADVVEDRIRHAQWLDSFGKPASVEALLASASYAGSNIDGVARRVEHTEALSAETLRAVGTISPAALAEALKPTVAAALADVEGASADEVATRVADALAARLVA